MAFTLRQTITGFSTTASLTLSTGVAPWPLSMSSDGAIIVFVACTDPAFFAASCSATDDNGNAYTLVGSATFTDAGGNLVSGFILAAFPIGSPGNPNVTVAVGQAQAYFEMSCIEVEVPQGLDFQGTSSDTSVATAPAGDAGTVTADRVNDLIVGLLIATSNDPQSILPINLSTNIFGSTHNLPGVAYNAAIANGGGAGTYSPLWALSPDSGFVGVTVSFHTEPAQSIGTADGAGDAAAIGLAIGIGVGSSAGSGTAVGISLAIKVATGIAAGTGQVVGHGTAAGIAVGHSSGRGDLSGIGRSLALARGLSYGLGDARGVGLGVSKAIGTAGGIGGAIAFPAGFPVPGYCSVLTDRAKIEILAFIKPVFASWSVMLMSAMNPPTQQQTIFTVTESVFPGYSRKAITHISNPILDGLGHAVCQADAVMWTNTGLVPVTVVGWGYVRTGSFPPLRSSGLFVPAKVLAPGHSLALIPMLDDTSLC